MKAKDKLSGEAIARKLDTELKTAREKLTSKSCAAIPSRSASCGG